jgi:hypothetical protein
VNSILATSIWILGTALSFASPSADAQQAGEGKAVAAWTAPKTPWGDPDIQGLWPSTEWKGVPLQRAESLGTRNTLTADEFAAREQRAAAEAAADAEQFVAPSTPDSKPGNNPPEYWQDRGKPKTQASLIVSPDNGRLPALTAEAEARIAARQAARKTKGPADSWLDRSLYERCITKGPLNFLPGTYNNGHEILQDKNYVVIRHEMINQAQMIPLDGRPFTRVRTYMGESRAHWEGDTLVVETKNYLTNGLAIGDTPVSEDLEIIEKFTRTGDHSLKYEATVDDPKTWTRPWTMAFEITEDPEYPLYEYACHEGNYAMVNILKGARAAEAAQRKKP